MADGGINREIATLPLSATALTKHTMNGNPLSPARHLVLESHPEGLYVFRYADDWSFSGDTWHANREDALAQIEYEFRTDELQWRPISETELNILTNPGTA
ncbi:MAG TPA: hypothetical protein VHU44_10350 [Acidobacteriaceae bacterium]|jgi:hypothetical protein|nr:hypothetical protein [Acidobacteriaceae bacterium]